MVNPATNPTARENPDQSVLTTPFILPGKETRELKILLYYFVLILKIQISDETSL